jgi:tRNA modification GTPase
MCADEGRVELMLGLKMSSDTVQRSTIAALASGGGRSAVAIIRISGPRTRFVLETTLGVLPKPRQASLRTIHDPESREVIDQGLVLWFPGPGSFTGEDMAELQLHGSPAVIQRVLQLLFGPALGVQAAEPGAFTRRAFENGKLDLAAVEGLADLIDAQTQAQRRQALRQLSGVLGQHVEQWRSTLLEALALAEASLDFSDEADVSEAALEQACGLITRLSAEMAAVLQDGRRGERLREGFVVVLAGPPNGGKSSLLNALAQRDVAIVSDRPGTTRDALEVQLELAGHHVILIDTAGLRRTEDQIEQIGIARSHHALRQADAVIWLDSADQPASERAEFETTSIIHILNKVDLPQAQWHREAAQGGLPVSIHSGVGLDSVLAKLTGMVQRSLGEGDAVLTRHRHRQHLEAAVAFLQQAQSIAMPELVTENIRLAARALGHMSGRVDVEMVLDRIFSSFCIGK